MFFILINNSWRKNANNTFHSIHKLCNGPFTRSIEVIDLSVNSCRMVEIIIISVTELPFVLFVFFKQIVIALFCCFFKQTTKQCYHDSILQWQLTVFSLFWTEPYFVWILSNIFLYFLTWLCALNVLHCHWYPCESLCKESIIEDGAGNEPYRIFLTNTNWNSTESTIKTLEVH